MNRSRHIITMLALALAVALAAGCSAAPTAEPTGELPTGYDPQPGAEAPAAPGLHTGAYKVKGGEKVVFTTDRGTFEVALRADKAPNTVSSFLELVDAKFYDGIKVHRIEPGFVMQAGDPLTRDLEPAAVRDVIARQKANAPAADDPQLGTGDPGWKMKAEFNDLKHDRGVIAMARSNDPDSAGSQFYVTLGPANFLDGQYTVFGTVTKGMDVVDKLGVGDTIRSARIVGGN